MNKMKNSFAAACAACAALLLAPAATLAPPARSR